MKVLMSCRQHPKHLCGGLSIASWNTAKAARDAGHDVTFLTAEHPSQPDLAETEEDGIKVSWVQGMFHDSTGYPDLYKCLRAHKEWVMGFDILHSQSSALTPCLEWGKPIIFQDHGTMLAAMQDDMNMHAFGMEKKFGIALGTSWKTDVAYNKMYDEFTLCIEGQREMDYLRKFTQVWATSAISAEDLVTRYFLCNVRLFYHSIYDLVYPGPREAASTPVVGFFALELDAPQKYAKLGLSQLLPIKDQISIKLVGNGPVTVAWAKEHFPRVEYTGYLQESDAFQALCSVDVLFECSCHHRGLNLAGITAMGLGIPVIAYPTGGHPDMIGEEALYNIYGPGGALVDPFDDQMACEAVRNITINRSVRSVKARLQFESKFLPKIVSKRLDELYAEILSG